MIIIHLSLSINSDNIIFMNKNNKQTSNDFMRGSFVSITTDSSNTKSRFTRKPSTSYQKSRSKSKQSHTPQISTPFLKSVSIQSESQITQAKKEMRNCKNQGRNDRGIMKQERERKREPTPVKSRKELARSEIFEEGNIEWQIRATELEMKMMEQRKFRQKYEKGYNRKSKELEKAKETLQEMLLENRTIKAENKKMEDKLKELQRVIVEGQTNLLTAKNNLEKLRQTIKQNRLVELQTENKKIKGDLQKVEAKNQQLKTEIKKLQKCVSEGNVEREKLRKRVNYEGMIKNQSMREQYLMKEIQKLKEKSEVSKEQKQKYLNSQIYQLEYQLQQAHNKISGLDIKLRMIEKTKFDEIIELKKKKQAELKNLRMKNCKLAQQLKTTHPNRYRQSDSILFQLSPEK